MRYQRKIGINSGRVEVRYSDIPQTYTRTFEIFAERDGDKVSIRESGKRGLRELPGYLHRDLKAVHPDRKFIGFEAKDVLLYTPVGSTKERVAGRIVLLEKPEQLELPGFKKADPRLLGFLPGGNYAPLASATKELVLNLWGDSYGRLLWQLKQLGLGETETEILAVLNTLLLNIEGRISDIQAEDITGSKPNALRNLKQMLNDNGQGKGEANPFAGLGTLSHRAFIALTKAWPSFSEGDLLLVKSLWEAFRAAASTPPRWVKNVKMATGLAGMIQAKIRDVAFECSEEIGAELPFLPVSNGDPAAEYCAQLTIATWAAYLGCIHPEAHRKSLHFYNVSLTPPGVFGNRVTDYIRASGARDLALLPSGIVLAADILFACREFCPADFKLKICGKWTKDGWVSPEELVQRRIPSRYVAQMKDYLLRTILSYFLLHCDGNPKNFPGFPDGLKGTVLQITPFDLPVITDVEVPPEVMFSLAGDIASRLKRLLARSKLRQAASMTAGILRRGGLTKEQLSLLGQAGNEEKQTEDRLESGLERFFKMFGYKT